MTLRYEALGLRFLVLSAQIHHRVGKIQNLGKMPRFFAEDAIQPLHPGTFLAAHGSGGEHNDVDMPEVGFCLMAMSTSRPSYLGRCTSSRMTQGRGSGTFA